LGLIFIRVGKPDRVCSVRQKTPHITRDGNRNMIYASVCVIE
jgi:hypothetical protein